ncbi:MAG TPA: hypothetical protein VFE53_12475 [Mucilaginibacter sp.]|jgi:hypothetical protein|nr:hypothetical protein [Mucilaginibacter sp.]
MKAFIYLFSITLLAASCAGHKKVAQASVAAASAIADGSSFEKAIFIKETHEQPGIDAEYAWIRDKYPNSKLNGQALVNQKNKPYDIIHITTADGTKTDIYFDISNFYGKF